MIGGAKKNDDHSAATAGGETAYLQELESRDASVAPSSSSSPTTPRP
jgi:hypothetical protein